MTALPNRNADAEWPESPPSARVWIGLFIVALVIPAVINIGSFRLSVYRFILIAALLPMMTLVFSGRVGRIRSFDLGIILFVAWAEFATLLAKGLDGGIETSGMHAIETLGAYFLARCYIRDQNTFYFFVRTLTIVIAVLLPLAMIEAISNRAFVLEILGKFMDVTMVMDKEPRLGLRRAQVTFEHQILFGEFCASGFALAIYCYAAVSSRAKAIGRGAMVAFTTFFSLSSGAYVAVCFQLGIIIWDMITRNVRNRWRILGVLLVASYFVVDALSNRTPYEVFVTTFTFDVGSSYNRVLIWQYGWTQVGMTPIFGIGPDGDWYRPWWMLSSMDNFWLVNAVSFGLPGLILLAGSLVLIAKTVMKLDLPPEHARIRAGALISLAGVCLSVFSVHLWNAIYVLFLFMWGSIVWLADVPANGRVTADSSDDGLRPHLKHYGGWPRPPSRPVARPTMNQPTSHAIRGKIFPSRRTVDTSDRRDEE